MAALTFLRHWRSPAPSGNLTAPSPTSTSASSTFSEDDDGGPFFDLDLDISTPKGDECAPTVAKAPAKPDPTPRPFSAASLLRSAGRLRSLTSRAKPKHPPPPPPRRRRWRLLPIGFRAADEETRLLSKEAVLGYLGRIGVGSSRRCGEREAAAAGVALPELEAGRRGTVCARRLRKSQSASGAAVVPRRRDIGLPVEEEEGILGAIAHCKRSFQGTRDETEPPLPRSRSDSCDERRQVRDLTSSMVYSLSP